MLIDWEYYQPDTWAGESGDHLFLIKELDDGTFYYVIGTTNDVILTGGVDALTSAQAISNRFAWVVNNCTDDERARILTLL